MNSAKPKKMNANREEKEPNHSGKICISTECSTDTDN